MARLRELLFFGLWGTTIATAAAAKSRYWLVTEQDREAITTETGVPLRIESF